MSDLEGLRKEIRIRLKNAFVNRCIRIAIDGYNLMREAQKYSPDWEEESLTANLTSYMKRSNEATIGRVDIVCESHQYTRDIELGKIEPKRAPRIDIRMSNWNTPKQRIYFIEAKNLCQNDWQKSNGSKVKASHYRTRYVDTGIDNFVTERYAEGCLVGYVLEGDTEPIIAGINNLMTKHRKRPSEILKDKETIHQHPDCYTSYHTTASQKELALRHIFMKMV